MRLTHQVVEVRQIAQRFGLDRAECLERARRCLNVARGASPAEFGGITTRTFYAARARVWVRVAREL